MLGMMLLMMLYMILTMSNYTSLYHDSCHAGKKYDAMHDAGYNSTQESKSIQISNPGPKYMG